MEIWADPDIAERMEIAILAMELVRIDAEVRAVVGTFGAKFWQISRYGSWNGLLLSRDFRGMTIPC